MADEKTNQTNEQENPTTNNNVVETIPKLEVPTDVVFQAAEEQARKEIEKADEANKRIEHFEVNENITLTWGKVVYGFPLIQLYIVYATSTKTLVPCVLTSNSGAGLLGASDSSTLPPLTNVLIAYSNADNRGYILGTLPSPALRRSETLNDVIAPDIELGFLSKVWEGIRELQDSLPDFSGKTSLDSLCLGEFCKNTTTGTMLFLDEFMAFIRAAEDCGLWCFLQDGLTRLAGLNLEQWSGLTEFQSSIIKVPSVYFGISSNIYDSLNIVENKPLTKKDVEDRKKYKNSKPIHTDFEYRSGIANGHLQFIIAPNGRNYYEQAASHVPLSQIYRSYTGDFGVRAAGGIYIVKAPNIKFPDRFRTNVQGEEKFDPPTTVVNNPATGLKGSNFVATSNIYDLHLNLFFGLGLRNFNKLKEHYKIVGSFRNAVTANPVPVLGKDSSLMEAPPPAEVSFNNNWPYQKAIVYPNTAHISLTPDGSVVIGDGYSSEMILSGGRIHITAPGDVLIDSGRNTIVFSGRDYINRARRDVDVVSTLGDVTIKAENNFNVTSGNNGKGGILLESRAETFDYREWEGGEGKQAKHPGINIVAPKSQVQVKANSIFNNACGLIVNRAPLGSIINTAPYIIDVVSCALVQQFDARQNEHAYCDIETTRKSPGKSNKPPKAPAVYNIFTHDMTVLHGNVTISNDLAVAGSLGIGEHAYVAGDVLVMSNKASQLAAIIKAGLGTEIINKAVTEIDHADRWMDNIMQNIFVSFKNESEYKSNNFIYVLPLWARRAGTKKDAWAERPLINPILKYDFSNGTSKVQKTSITFPFPGRAYYDKSLKKKFIPCILVTNGVYSNLDGDLIVGIEQLGNYYDNAPVAYVGLPDRPVVDV